MAEQLSKSDKDYIKSTDVAARFSKVMQTSVFDQATQQLIERIRQLAPNARDGSVDDAVEHFMSPVKQQFENARSLLSTKNPKELQEFLFDPHRSFKVTVTASVVDEDSEFKKVEGPNFSFDCSYKPLNNHLGVFNNSQYSIALVQPVRSEPETTGSSA